MPLPYRDTTGGNRMKLRAIACLALLLSCAPLAVQAQALPTLKEFYFDDDAAGRPIQVVDGEGEEAMQRLMRIMERGQRNADLATAQLARLAIAHGRTETGMSLYRQALEATAARSSQRQAIQWNYGWDLMRQGDAEAALRQWVELMEGRLNAPAWLPPTLALALWRTGRRAEAVAWFAAAVRTYPDRWPYPANLPSLLPDWRQDERATLAEVQAAWAENPPA